MPLELAVARLDKAIKLYAEVSERPMADIINRRMGFVAKAAFQLTPVVTPEQIRAELQVQTHTLAYFKNGKRRKRPVAFYKPSDLARAIIAGRLWKQGINPRLVLSPGELEKKVEAMVSSRLMGTAYLKSGWIPAMSLFESRGGENVAFRSVHGAGRQATPDNLTAIATNSVADLWQSDASGYARAQNALEEAFKVETDELLDEVDKRLREAWGNVDKMLA